MSVVGKRILVIDDEERLLQSIETFLTKKGFHVYTAKTAKEILDIKPEILSDVDLIVTDIVLPKVSGIVFISELRTRFRSKVPVIAISAFSESRAMVSKVLGQGVYAYIEKPFSLFDLLSEILLVLSGKAKPLNRRIKDPTNLKFKEVRVETFIDNPSVNYDVYIKLSEKKYLKVINKGQKIDIERIESYKKKYVDFLYVEEEDFKKYTKEQLNFLKEPKVKTDQKKRAEEVNKINELVLKEMYSENFDKDVFDASVELAKENVDLILSNQNFYNLLKELEAYSSDEYRHVAAVNIFSAMLSKHIGWVGKPTLLKLSIASFYHDVGKKFLEKEILDKPYRQYSTEELTQYKSHPIKSFDILAEFESVSEDILKIVAQHHENADGTGFPASLKGRKIHPLAKILRISDDYANLVLAKGENEKFSHEEAINIMEKQKEKYDSLTFKKFLEVFTK